jgi:predicted nucleic acid-binding protein
VKLAVAETGHEEIVALLAASDDSIVVPDFMFVELANVLWRKLTDGQISLGQAKEALSHSLATFTQVVPGVELVDSALELAVRLKHPAYDCAYLACALKESGQIVTADRRFAAAASRGGYSDRLIVLGATRP